MAKSPSETEERFHKLLCEAEEMIKKFTEQFANATRNIEPCSNSVCRTTSTVKSACLVSNATQANTQVVSKSVQAVDEIASVTNQCHSHCQTKTANLICTGTSPCESKPKTCRTSDGISTRQKSPRPQNKKCRAGSPKLTQGKRLSNEKPKKTKVRRLSNASNQAGERPSTQNVNRENDIDSSKRPQSGTLSKKIKPALPTLSSDCLCGKESLNLSGKVSVEFSKEPLVIESSPCNCAQTQIREPTPIVYNDACNEPDCENLSACNCLAETEFPKQPTVNQSPCVPCKCLSSDESSIKQRISKNKKKPTDLRFNGTPVSSLTTVTSRLQDIQTDSYPNFDESGNEICLDARVSSGSQNNKPPPTSKKSELSVSNQNKSSSSTTENEQGEKLEDSLKSDDLIEVEPYKSALLSKSSNIIEQMEKSENFLRSEDYSTSKSSNSTTEQIQKPESVLIDERKDSVQQKASSSTKSSNICSIKQGVHHSCGCGSTCDCGSEATASEAKTSVVNALPTIKEDEKSNKLCVQYMEPIDIPSALVITVNPSIAINPNESRPTIEIVTKSNVGYVVTKHSDDDKLSARENKVTVTIEHDSKFRKEIERKIEKKGDMAEVCTQTDCNEGAARSRKICYCSFPNSSNESSRKENIITGESGHSTCKCLITKNESNNLSSYPPLSSEKQSKTPESTITGTLAYNTTQNSIFRLGERIHKKKSMCIETDAEELAVYKSYQVLNEDGEQAETFEPVDVSYIDQDVYKTYVNPEGTQGKKVCEFSNKSSDSEFVEELTLDIPSESQKSSNKSSNKSSVKSEHELTESTNGYEKVITCDYEEMRKRNKEDKYGQYSDLQSRFRIIKNNLINKTEFLRTQKSHSLSLNSYDRNNSRLKYFLDEPASTRILSKASNTTENIILEINRQSLNKSQLENLTQLGLQKPSEDDGYVITHDVSVQTSLTCISELSSDDSDANNVSPKKSVISDSNDTYNDILPILPKLSFTTSRASFDSTKFTIPIGIESDDGLVKNCNDPNLLDREHVGKACTPRLDKTERPNENQKEVVIHNGKEDGLNNECDESVELFHRTVEDSNKLVRESGRVRPSFNSLLEDSGESDKTQDEVVMHPTGKEVRPDQLSIATVRGRARKSFNLVLNPGEETQTIYQNKNECTTHPTDRVIPKKFNESASGDTSISESTQKSFEIKSVCYKKDTETIMSNTSEMDSGSDYAYSEGERSCNCSVSTGEIHTNLYCPARKASSFINPKQSLLYEEFRRAHLKVLKKKIHNSNWVSYYVSQSGASPDLPSTGENTRSVGIVKK